MSKGPYFAVRKKFNIAFPFSCLADHDREHPLNTVETAYKVTGYKVKSLIK